MNMRTTPRFSQTSSYPHFLPQTCPRRLSATISDTTTTRFRYVSGRPSSHRSLLTYPRSSSYFTGRRSSDSGVINCTHAMSGLRVYAWPSSASPAGGAQIQECSRTKSRTRLPQPAKTTGSGHSPDGSTSRSGRVRHTLYYLPARARGSLTYSGFAAAHPRQNCTNSAAACCCRRSCSKSRVLP